MQLFLVETLRPLGIDITVIDLCDSSDSSVPSLLKAAGAEVVSFPFDKLFSPGEFVRLTQFLRAQKFDLLHTYLTYANIVGPFAGKLARTPVIASLRSADGNFTGYTTGRKALETFSLRYVADRIMPNGNAVAEITAPRIGHSRPLDVIPNAVDFYPPITDEDRIGLRIKLVGDATRPLILSVGRLSPAKGFYDLLNAFARVHDQYPSVALVIAGGGDMHNELDKHLHDLGLENHAFLLGTRDDTLRLMGAADIYVNSSHWEGTPVSVLEAMAAGLPIVATKVGENPYLLSEDSGIVVPAHNPEQLAIALCSLLETPELWKTYGQSARERVKSHYSRDVWRRSLLELYAMVTPKAKAYFES